MTKEETREQLDNITQSLQQLIEQTQVKISLLKLETRPAWQDIEKGLFKVQSFLQKDWGQTKQSLDEAQLQTHLGMMEAREEWNEFKQYLQEAIQNLKTEETFDHSKLQAHLANMEIEDRFQDKRKQWEQDYENEVKPQMKGFMEKMHKDMETMAQSLID